MGLDGHRDPRSGAARRTTRLDVLLKWTVASGPEVIAAAVRLIEEPEAPQAQQDRDFLNAWFEGIGDVAHLANAFADPDVKSHAARLDLLGTSLRDLVPELESGEPDRPRPGPEDP